MVGFVLAEKFSGKVLLEIPAARELCLGPPQGKHLSGGACLGYAVAALEAATERPLICASAQYLAPVKCGEMFDIQVQNTKGGRSVTQASAALVRDGQHCVTVSAALGSGDSQETRQWASPPDVPKPENCPPLPFIRMDDGDLHSFLDVRIVSGAGGIETGGLTFWVKAQGPVTAPVLAVVGDYLPECVHWALGRPAGATSLDNSLRIFSLQETDWLLCESRLFSVNRGLFHGRMSIFSNSGELLAVASQSGVVREIKR